MTDVRILKQAVLMHVAEEEGGMFLEAGQLGADTLESLGGQMEARQQALKAARRERVRAGQKAPPKVA